MPRRYQHDHNILTYPDGFNRKERKKEIPSSCIRDSVFYVIFAVNVALPVQDSITVNSELLNPVIKSLWKSKLYPSLSMNIGRKLSIIFMR